jgi:hypothetical protein
MIVDAFITLINDRGEEIHRTAIWRSVSVAKMAYEVHFLKAMVPEAVRAVLDMALPTGEVAMPLDPPPQR